MLTENPQKNGAGKPLGDQNLMAGGSGSGSSATSSGAASPSSSSKSAATSGRSVSGVVFACLVGVSTLAGAMLVL